VATAFGRADPSVAEFLLQSPWYFEFFQAVRLLALTYPERRPISGFRQSLKESIRFCANLSMAFPPSAIQEITHEAKDDDPMRMTVNFMGLTGPMGVLPQYYTEYLIARGYVNDNTAAAFFDLFNHRLISLFYLAWEKHHFAIGYERKSLSSEPRCDFTGYLFDLIGMGTTGLRGRLGFADSVLLSYAGLIAQRPHSTVALEGVLRDYFRIPIKIDQFIGKWCYLDQEDLSCLGENSVSGQLGCGAIAGGQVWNPQARFRIRVGPLTWERFQSFLPGSSALHELVALTRYFVNSAMDFEVQCIVLAREVPYCQLSDDSSRLGLSSWLKTEPFSADAQDLVLAVGSSGDP
jgi:type VI secretion system protein ImpH